MLSPLAAVFYGIITYIQIATGFLSANRCMTRVKSRRAMGYCMFIIIMLMNTAVYALRYTTESFTYLNIAALYFIPFYLMNEGPFPHKAIIYVTQYYVPLTLFMAASFVAEIFAVYETIPYFIIMTAITVCVYGIYFVLHIKYGKQICDRLFSYTKPGLWSMYLIIPFACLFITGYFYFTGDIIWHPRRVEASLPYFTLPLFMLFCYVFLIAAIIGAHDRVLAVREIDLARNAVSSGRDYYEKLMVLTENLQRMKHDHKFHLSAMRSLIKEGQNEEAHKLLNTLSEKHEEIHVTRYCDSRVINALLYGYEERCGKENVEFQAKIKIENTNDEYELCIIIGNLLENAMEACRRIETGRAIQVVVKPQGEQLAVMVRNTFNGTVLKDGEQYVSAKKGGGLGLQSVQAVAARYDGRLVTEPDGQWFKAFVLLRMG